MDLVSKCDLCHMSYYTGSFYFIRSPNIKLSICHVR